MLATARKLIDLLPAGAKLRFMLLLGPISIVALLEMVSVGAVLPVMQILIQGKSLADAFGDYAHYLPDIEDAGAWLAAALLSAFVIKNIAVLANTYLISNVVQRAAAQFMTRMYEIYLARPVVFHQRHNSAELVRNLGVGSWQTFNCVQIFLNSVMDVILMLAVFMILLLVTPGVTLVTMAVLGAIAVLFHRLVGPLFQRWGEIAVTNEAEVIKWVNQSLGALRDVKLTWSYDYMSGEVGRRAQTLALYNSRAMTALSSPRLVIEVIVVAGCLAIAFALFAGVEDRADVIPILGLYGLAAMRLMPSLNRLLANASSVRYRAAYIDVLWQDYMEGQTDTDVDSRTRAQAENAPPLAFTRDIRLVGVSYRYDTAERNALDKVSLTIAKGESVGFVGPSGAGKSSLIDLILGFLVPTEGRIEVDRVDIAKDRARWQRRIGYVPQQISLLDDTLRRNIAFGIPDAEIDEGRIAQVVEMARLGEVVAAAPQGLDTVAGERGVRLSGGQRQRIAIARALYRDPDVLVLDEATAALDTETEREVTQAIDALAGRKTLLIIAHRLTTVIKCDRIVFIEDGRVVAAGPYHELAQSSAPFQSFVRHASLDAKAAE